MGVKQFLGIKWTENSPKMLFYDNITKKIEYEECEGSINIQKTGEKRCKGYYDLETKKIVPCKNYIDLSRQQFFTMHRMSK